MIKIRIDKYLSNQGIGTRTEVKKLIKLGKVANNGNVVKDQGIKVDIDTDLVTVSGKQVSYDKYIYIMLNKPKGVISATEDKKEQTVIDIINHPLKLKIFPVGRLDKDTTGLLLLTNDGALAHSLLSPKKHVDKNYTALIDGIISNETIDFFEKGVILEDGYKTMPAKLIIQKDNKFINSIKRKETISYTQASITIKEGKFHQVKRMFESVNMKVIELNRDRMGTLKLDNQLKLGDYRELTKEEIRKLKLT